MLVISQKVGDKIKLDSGITITVLKVHGNKVRLGIDAPKNVKISQEKAQNPSKNSENA